VLTGKYNDALPEGSRLAAEGLEWLRGSIQDGTWPAKVEKLRQLGALAKELGVPQATLAIAWCLKNPHVSTVILGATRVEQLQANLKALDCLDQLTPEVMARIDAIFPVTRG
jgi:aryl-alcohol dehydrogenase-like predicted oxidoreductase